jgi:hypothetical protein
MDLVINDVMKLKQPILPEIVIAHHKQKRILKTVNAKTALKVRLLAQ